MNDRAVTLDSRNHRFAVDLSGARLQYLKREFLSINYFLVEAVDGPVQ